MQAVLSTAGAATLAETSTGPGRQTAADVTFRCNTDTFVLLMYRRLSLDAAIAAGRLAADGDLDMTAAFKAWLEGN